MLRQRHVTRLLLGTLIGRLPGGMVPVALLLLVAEQGGSLAAGGLLCALYGLASAAGQPVLGKVVDRRGQTRVISAAVLTSTMCLLVLSTTDTAAHPVLAAGVAVGAGLSTPPLEAGLRALWPTVIPDSRLRQAALALDTGSQGLIYITGPPLVAALSAVSGPATAIGLAALLGIIGTSVVVTSAPSRNWLPDHRGRSAKASRPRGSRGPRMLFAAMTGVGFALGAMNVWAVAMAERSGTELLSGLIPAALSCGSLTGGILYGRYVRPGAPARQLMAFTALFTAGWLPLMTGPGPIGAVLLTTVPGLLLTAVITLAFLTVDALTATGSRTEAYAWLIAAVGAGQAAGTALAGAFADQPFTGAALPAAGAAFTLVVLLSARRSFASAAERRQGRHRRTAVHRFPATTDRRSALPEAQPDAQSEPFMTIRHTTTGEITTTGYNAAARRILLQDGFEETPECTCRGTEPGTERTHGPARQPASCSSPAAPCAWTDPSVGW